MGTLDGSEHTMRYDDRCCGDHPGDHGRPALPGKSWCAECLIAGLERENTAVRADRNKMVIERGRFMRERNEARRAAQGWEAIARRYRPEHGLYCTCEPCAAFRELADPT